MTSKKSIRKLAFAVTLLFILLALGSYKEYKDNKMNDCIMQNIHNYDYEISKRTCEIELNGD